MNTNVPTPSAAPTTSDPNKLWLAAAGKKETAVRLNCLPQGVQFTDEPIFYDEGRKILVYRGLMFHSSYVYLHKMSDAKEYQLAIDQLYLASAHVPSQRSYGRLLKVVAPVAAAAIAIGLWLCLH